MRKIMNILMVVVLAAMVALTVQSVQAGDYSLQMGMLPKPTSILSHTWNIVKTANQSSLTFMPGQGPVAVEYTVTVSQETTANVNMWARIDLANPNQYPVTLTSVTATVTPDTATNITCAKMEIQPGELVECWFYEAVTTDPTPEVILDVYATINGSSEHFQQTFAVNLDPATNQFATRTETDECINVTDTVFGSLGTVCANEAPKTFTYMQTFGTGAPADIVLECGENTSENVASFITNDTETTGEASWTVISTVICGGAGCTLTPGYWKTHSINGPAPYDPTWNGQEGNPFFLSGQTWYSALWTEPKGNPYYILAHAYIAAVLNVQNGATTTPAVDAALASARTIFTTYQASYDWSKVLKFDLVSLASTLDQYNNGLVGPGHCSE